MNQHISTSSLASEGSPLPRSGQDSEQSDFQKLTGSAAAFSQHDTQQSQISATYETSHENRLKVLLSLQEAFRVSLSALRVNNVDVAMKDSYGMNSLESSAKYDPASHSLRTFQACLQLTEESHPTEFLATFARSGMIVSGILYQLPPLVLLTKETGCGFLPTPTRSDAECGRILTDKMMDSAFQTSTGTWRKKWTNGDSSNLGLTRSLALSLPTIGFNEYKGSSIKRHKGSTHFRGAKMSEGLRTCETDPIYLNPYFGELVMGYPIGWTELQASETASYLK